MCIHDEWPGRRVSCERGPKDRRPTLHLARQAGAGGTLKLPLADDITCEVFVPQRYVVLLRLITDAWRADDDEIEAHRGFRTTEEIGAAFGSPPGNGRPITGDSVRSYVHDLKVRIRKAISALRSDERNDLEMPPLLETGRKLGYRIGPCGLDIVRPRSRATFTQQSTGAGAQAPTHGLT